MIIYKDKVNGDYFVVENFEEDGTAQGVRIGGDYKDGRFHIAAPGALHSFYEQVYPTVEVKEADHDHVIVLTVSDDDEVWGYVLWDSRTHTLVEYTIYGDEEEALNDAEYINTRRESKEARLREELREEDSLVIGLVEAIENASGEYKRDGCCGSAGCGSGCNSDE